MPWFGIQKRSLKPHILLLHFAPFVIRKRWKNLAYVLFAVVLLVLVALGTVTVEFGTEESNCHCYSYSWNIQDLYHTWKNNV
jgi:hypothetical protein